MKKRELEIGDNLFFILLIALTAAIMIFGPEDGSSGFRCSSQPVKAEAAK